MAQTTYLNPAAESWRTTNTVESRVKRFHESLPDYRITPLVPLKNAAEELGLGHVFMKDESSRFGLPAFKILGVSWATFRAVAQATACPETVTLEELGDAARSNGVSLVCCSEGNCGRAVARMARYLGIPATVYVPKNCHEQTIQIISNEGARVLVVDGNYDDSILAARKDSESSGALLIQDTSWAGYEVVPKWIVEGYSTMLTEVDEQIRHFTDKPITHAIASVGVGSWAHAVTAHYKSSKHDHPVFVVTVEPDTAACVKTSLERGEITTVETGDSIMCGMNCGTPSMIGWPILREGVDAAVTVTDLEAHHDVQYLHSQGVQPGPCGAAPLSALRRIKEENLLDLGPDSVVVLFCTEGAREYPAPV